MMVAAKRILVKLPLLKERFFTAFTFIKTLYEENYHGEITILIHEEDIYSSQFFLVPLKVVVFPARVTGLLKTHKFVVNSRDLNFFDAYFDLENSFTSSFIGWNLGVQERIGYDMGFNRHFLTRKIVSSSRQYDEDYFMDLCGEYFHKNYKKQKIILDYLEENLDEQNIKEKHGLLFDNITDKTYNFIIIYNYESFKNHSIWWNDFLDRFKESHFILWPVFDFEKISDLFSTIDDCDRRFTVLRDPSLRDLKFVSTFISGVLTDHTWSEGLCLQLGLNVCSLYFESHSHLAYDYLHCCPHRFYVGQNIVEYVFRNDQKHLNNLDELADTVLNIFEN